MSALRVPSRIALAVVLMGAFGACGAVGDRASPPPSGQPTTTQPGTLSCGAPERGYRLQFPRTWYTNDAGVAEPCRFFHP